jgi:hypothetical protein
MAVSYNEVTVLQQLLCILTVVKLITAFSKLDRSAFQEISIIKELAYSSSVPNHRLLLQQHGIYCYSYSAVSITQSAPDFLQIAVKTYSESLNDRDLWPVL